MMRLSTRVFFWGIALLLLAGAPCLEAKIVDKGGPQVLQLPPGPISRKEADRLERNLRQMIQDHNNNFQGSRSNFDGVNWKQERIQLNGYGKIGFDKRDDLVAALRKRIARHNERIQKNQRKAQEAAQQEQLRQQQEQQRRMQWEQEQQRLRMQREQTERLKRELQMQLEQRRMEEERERLEQERRTLEEQRLEEQRRQEREQRRAEKEEQKRGRKPRGRQE